MSERSGVSAFSGFLVGAAVGAVVALLVAPATGADTRRRLGETTRHLKEGASGKIEQVRNTFRDGAKQVKNAVSEGREEYRRSTQDQLETSARSPGL
jgi:gas vesicle protein